MSAFSALPKLTSLNMRMCKGVYGSVEAGLSACGPVLTQVNLKFTQITGSIDFFSKIGRAYGNLSFLSVAGTEIEGDIGCLRWVCGVGMPLVATRPHLPTVLPPRWAPCPGQGEIWCRCYRPSARAA